MSDYFLYNFNSIVSVAFRTVECCNVIQNGQNKIISDLAQTVLSFETKLKLFKQDLTQKKFNHFPSLKSVQEKILGNAKEMNTESYVQKLEELEDEFKSRFSDLKSLKVFCFFGQSLPLKCY